MSDDGSHASLAETLDGAWRHLEAGARSAGAPAHLVTLATAGLGGGAEARMVVLRAADRAKDLIAVHTDAASAKMAEIARDPVATVLAWIPEDAFQIRLRVRMSRRSGTAAEWSGLGDSARRLYGGEPPPGSRIFDPATFVARPDARRYAVLEGRVAAIETLRLDPGTHRRALFMASDDFRGDWLAP